MSEPQICWHEECSFEDLFHLSTTYSHRDGDPEEPKPQGPTFPGAAASHWVIPKSSPWLTMGATFTIPSHGRLMVCSQGFPLESRIWNLAM